MLNQGRIIFPSPFCFKVLLVGNDTLLKNLMCLRITMVSVLVLCVPGVEIWAGEALWVRILMTFVVPKGKVPWGQIACEQANEWGMKARSLCKALVWEIEVFPGGEMR